uniref:EF-hand domain-containing protein n=1 Tax=Chromera velia CCMP2878 TaxID=1169474 RepID=A0A0G4HFL8_9ALVE|eukprot:Cvel_27112.t1-p1 / transcript=Cvel_27112.t1 / gene=Cvel_27112 / organism=Chromera_velia_CCMP2878 / gene_product=Calmodulin, flagellar, putative / transcript_product=Calmodulin, flagellar, putative / location=Cvel_scaffold3326:13075-17293(-) / protein_length=697 / sequence_SO=supercontig / SO=protein_coding / is_pseudo=false
MRYPHFISRFLHGTLGALEGGGSEGGDPSAFLQMRQAEGGGHGHEDGHGMDAHEFVQRLWVATGQLPLDGFGMFQTIFLTVTYFSLQLFFARVAMMGMECLLLVPKWDRITGPVLMPMVDLLPEFLILLTSQHIDTYHSGEVMGQFLYFSMLNFLVPLFIVVVFGRVNIEKVSEERTDPETGEVSVHQATVCTYNRPPGAAPGWRKLTADKRFSLTQTGIEVVGARENAFLLFLSAIAYIPLWGVFVRRGVKDGVFFNSNLSRIEEFASLCLCLLLLVVYLGAALRRSLSAKGDDLITARVNELRVHALQNGSLDIRTVLFQLKATTHVKGGELTEELRNQMAEVLRPFFEKFDRDGSGSLDSAEVASLLRELGEHPSDATVQVIMQEADTDGTGTVEMDEFLVTLMKYANGDLKHLIDGSPRHMKGKGGAGLAAIMRMQKKGKGGGADVGGGGEAPHTKHDDHGHGGHGGHGGADGHEHAHDLEAMDEVAMDAHLESHVKAITGLGDKASPSTQTNTFLMFGLLYTVIGCLGCFLMVTPMVEAFWTFGYRLGIPDEVTASILIPLAAMGPMAVKLPYEHARERTRKMHSLVVQETIGKAVIQNTLLFSIVIFQTLVLDLAWQFPAETLALSLLTVMTALHIYARPRLVTIEGFYFLLLWFGFILLLQFAFRPFFRTGVLNHGNHTEEDENHLGGDH